MRDCVYFLGDLCITKSNGILIGDVLAGVILIVIGIIIYNYWNPGENTSGIQTVDMKFKKSVPEQVGSHSSGNSSSSWKEKAKDIEHPYRVGDFIFVGSYEGLGARLEIRSYNEEDMKVHCKLWVEAPLGSTDIHVDHTWEGDFQLGMAIVRYSLNGNGEFTRIGLEDEKLDCNYSVVIEAGRSTNEDITR